jgi:hypothetical protein
MRKPPPLSGIITADTVVWRPRRPRALTSRVRSLSPGSTALSRLDFPAPDGPVTTDVRPAIASASSSIPDDDRRRQRVRLREYEQAVDELGNGIGIPGGGDDHDPVDVGGDRTPSPPFRHPAREEGAAGLDSGDAVEFAPGLGLEPHHVAHHDLRLAALDPPAEHRPQLPVRGGDAVGRAVPLEHGPDQRRHHSPGARALASSSAAFTS